MAEVSGVSASDTAGAVNIFVTISPVAFMSCEDGFQEGIVTGLLQGLVITLVRGQPCREIEFGRSDEHKTMRLAKGRLKQCKVGHHSMQ